MKRIAIIGGGISGLTVLHYLKQRFADTVDIVLYERESTVGGTIHTFEDHNAFFETGPNAFLDNQTTTWQLITELGLEDQVIDANISSRRRYIKMAGQLYLVPMDPMGLIKTPLLSFFNKCRMIQGLFNKDISTDQSIYDYVAKRFGIQVAEHLVDPFVSGVYAGDIKHLHMGSTLSKMFKKDKNHKKAKLRSFKQGMGQLIDALYQRYQPHIQTKTAITQLSTLKADVIICATTAYAASPLVEAINPELAKALQQVIYAPVAVAGLLFNKNSFKNQPDGFGYLIPSREGKDILGVLIENNAFAGRANEDQVMIRVMVGGAHHPEIVNQASEEILIKTIQEIDSSYGLTGLPEQTWIKVWPKGIPQYDLNYPILRKTIAEQLTSTPNIFLCANYLNGVSFNDCISNAKSIATSIRI